MQDMVLDLIVVGIKIEWGIMAILSHHDSTK